MSNEFPRGKKPPTQSPLFWVNQKDRYLRQLLIRDIEELTGRDLIIYFTDCDRTNARIDRTDDCYLAELLGSRSRNEVDLLLETNGGETDATEKLCSMLHNAKPDLRVIVPRRAKSNGTVIAFCGKEIVMGPSSELGPIDPSIGGVPVEYLINANRHVSADDDRLVVLQMAKDALAQTIGMAKRFLKTGMLSGKEEYEIEKIVTKLATKDKYQSHGAVINATEAETLGLKVTALDENSTLWQKLWLLRTMYAFDCQQKGYAKLFESNNISLPVSDVRTQ